MWVPMKVLPLNANELARLDSLGSNSDKDNFDWVKTRFRAINEAFRKASNEIHILQVRLDDK